MIKLVVYDLDGTLIDSATVVTAILNEMRMEANKPPVSKDRLAPWLSMGGDSLVVNALEISNSDAPFFLDDFRGRYMKISTPDSAVFPGVRDVLDSLLSAGISLAICTNKPRNLAEKVLIETDLLNKFSYISAGGDLSTQKPHPKNLEICLNHFEVTHENALMVGDSVVDQKISHSLNVPFVHYLPGYNDGVDAQKTHIKINHHMELVDLIRDSLISYNSYI